MSDEAQKWKARFDRERSARKEAESLLEDKSRELYELNQSLEQKVQDQLDLLLRQSKHAAMGEMMDAIAHQWKQPLSVISTSSSTLAFRNSRGMIEEGEIEKTNEKILLQIQHLTDTMDQFRKFFRPDEPKSFVDLRSMIQVTLELEKELLLKYKINTEINCDEVISYELIPTEFKHLLLNLIRNAKDAFESNETNERQIVFTVSKNTKDITIEVLDNAGGIPEGVIDKIFQPNITTKALEGGTGIGLYLVKQIIDKLDGSIEVENKKWFANQYTGANFIIKLPIK
jgi:signal transduction histidine kinase